MGGRAAETRYHPGQDLCDRCGTLEEYYRDALKRRCRAALCTPAEALRRLARGPRRIGEQPPHPWVAFEFYFGHIHIQRETPSIGRFDNRG